MPGERAQTSRAGPGRQVRLRSYDITKIISELNKLNNGGEADAGPAKPSAKAQQERKLQPSQVLNCSALHCTAVTCYAGEVLDWGGNVQNHRKLLSRN